MFCVHSMLILLSSLFMLQLLPCPAVAQRDLGFILEAPETAVVPLGTIAKFSCTAVGNVFWEVNRSQVDETNVNTFAGANIFVPLSTPNHSMVVINVTTVNNGSNITCLVEEEGDVRILNRSAEVRLLAYGAPSPPFDLNVTVPSRGLGVWLTWERGFSLEGEEVKFIVVSRAISSGVETETCTNLTSIMLTFAPFEDRCLLYNFTVFSMNGFSGSSSSVGTENVLLPAVPTALEQVNVSVSFQGASSVKIQFAFEAPSPCAEFGVDTYTIVFIETTDSSTFNVSRANRDRNVLLSVTDSDGILLGRPYNFTMIAENSAGSSAFIGSFYTTGLQSSRVVGDLVSASVTCEFAAGSLAVGCQVLFGSAFQFNVSRDPGSTSATDSVTFPDELRDSLLLEMVAVSEISADGSVSQVFLQPVVTIMATATTTTTVSTMTTTEVTTDNNTIINDDPFLSGNTLYIVVGAIAAVIILLLLIIIVVVCIIRSSHQRNKNRRSLELSEELKPNYMYDNRSAPSNHIASTDFIGQENSRQVRSNTYDDPRSDLAVRNGTAAPPAAVLPPPTYETIQSAKNGMLIAGPPVLNPVYGPTGTPNTPTSPRLPPSKTASNPVYAESTIPQQFSDVSGLNPVYASVGKQVDSPPARAVDQTAERYANAQISHPGLVPGPAASIQGHDNPATPMYEELKAATGLATGMTGNTMTKNESYGLISVEVKSDENSTNR